MAGPQKRLSLSKSLFIRGLQCYKSLYLDRYNPELKDPVSESQQRIFDGGTEVGLLAQDLFPGGIEITYEGFTHEEQIERTKAELEKGTTTIYEATFNHDDVFVKADILHKGKGAAGWELYEVKASTELKEVYINDVALQLYVLTGSGLDIIKASLVHLNNQYVRQGALELDKLFTIEDITVAAYAKQPFVQEQVINMREMLACDTLPAIDIGEYCEDPYPCDFTSYCWQHIPEDSVFDLKQRGVRPIDLYREGIALMKDIPPDRLSGK